MRKVLLFLCLLIFLTSCRGKEYLKTVPSNKTNSSGFKYFKWSPDGKMAAVYSSGKLYIINPDGVKLQDSIKIDYLQLKNFDWSLRSGKWEFEEINVHGKKSEFDWFMHNEINEGEEEKVDIGNTERIGNLYESITADEGKRLYLGYTNRYFELVSLEIENNSYKTIARSTKILFGLNYYNNCVYFVSIDPKDGHNKYYLYKFLGDHIESINIENP